VAERIHEEPEHVRLISCWHSGAPLAETVEYDTEGMPCAEVVG
jgi:hypothetical protein